MVPTLAENNIESTNLHFPWSFHNQPTALKKNHSGTIDEEEFVAIYTLAAEGKVLGLDEDNTYYSPPRQLRKWGEHENHPATDWQDLFFGERNAPVLPPT